MSKADHDARVAVGRGAETHYDRPWYASAAGLLQRCGLRGGRVLDLCCGNAEFSEILRTRFDMQVTCADYAPAHLEHARRLGFETLPVDFDQATETVDRLAADQAGRFDLVVSLATIEHVFDADAFLRFAHGVLKPGGQFLVNTPNIPFAAYRLNALFSGNRPFGEGHHVRFWDYRFLRTNLFLNGFRTVVDARQWYALPTDTLTRAFRGRRWLADPVAWLFHGCRWLQHLPGGKQWFADELTVLAEKEEVFPVGFQIGRVQAALACVQDGPEAQQAILRLREARRRGWLDEHLVLAAFVDGLDAGRNGK